MRERLNQFRSVGAAMGFLVAYYQVQAGIVPESDLLVVGGAFAAVVGGIGDFCHGWLLEQVDSIEDDTQEGQSSKGVTATTDKISEVRSTKESGSE
jgi:hypothetical protein